MSKRQREEAPTAQSFPSEPIDAKTLDAPQTYLAEAWHLKAHVSDESKKRRFVIFASFYLQRSHPSSAEMAAEATDGNDNDNVTTIPQDLTPASDATTAASYIPEYRLACTWSLCEATDDNEPKYYPHSVVDCNFGYPLFTPDKSGKKLPDHQAAGARVDQSRLDLALGGCGVTWDDQDTCYTVRLKQRIENGTPETEVTCTLSFAPEGPLSHIQPCDEMFCYYFPRCRVKGSIKAEDTEVSVTGTGWYEREFANPRAVEGEEVWYSLALQLDSGAEVRVECVGDQTAGVFTESSTSQKQNLPKVTWLTESRCNALKDFFPKTVTIRCDHKDMVLKVAVLDTTGFPTNLAPGGGYLEQAVAVTGTVSGTGNINGVGYFKSNIVSNETDTCGRFLYTIEAGRRVAPKDHKAENAIISEQLKNARELLSELLANNRAQIKQSEFDLTIVLQLLKQTNLTLPEGIVGCLHAYVRADNHEGIQGVINIATLASPPPVTGLEKIKEAATLKEVEWTVFVDKADQETFEERSVLPLKLMKGKMVHTTLMDNIREFLTANKTVLLAGPSGSGKTMAVLSLAADQPKSDSLLWAVVYATPLSFKEQLKNIQQPKKAPDQDFIKTRNSDTEILLSLIVEQLVPSEQLRDMRELKENQDLQLVIALDEMGSYSNVVRAMCSVDFKKGLHKRLKLSPSVTVHLVAAGTGVGGDDTKPGSLDTNYRIMYTDGDDDDESNNKDKGKESETKAFISKKDNVSVFNTHLNLKIQVSEKDLSGFPKQLRDAIYGNARTAAILGRDIRAALLLTFGTDAPRALFRVDLQPFVGPAIFTYKSKNGMCSLNIEQLDMLRVGAVRASFFPHAPCLYKKEMEIKYGLIVDKYKWELKEDDGKERFDLERHSYSRYHVPEFTSIALATLTGCAPVTKSVASGAAFEEYLLAVLHLIACAASCTELFDIVLSKGALAPLNEYMPDLDSGPFASRTIGLKELPPSKPERIHIVKDLTFNSKSDVTDQDKEETTEKKAKRGVATMDKDDARAYFDAFKAKLVGAVRASLEPLKRQIEINSTFLCRVATFRCPPQAPFADVFLFVDDTLYLFQAKDHKGGYNFEGYDLERWKMGEVDEAALKAFGEMTIARETAKFDKDANIDSTGPGITPNEATQHTETLDTETMREQLKIITVKKQREEEKIKSVFENNRDNPRRLLVELAKVWYECTRIRLEKIKWHFIVPRSTKAAPKRATSTTLTVDEWGGHTIQLSGAKHLLSVENVKFLKFDATRDEPARNANNCDNGYGVSKAYDMPAADKIKYYIFSMRKSSEKMNPENKKTVIDACEKAENWLAVEMQKKSEDYERCLEELENICNPIMSKMHQSVASIVDAGPGHSLGSAGQVLDSPE